MIRKCCGMFLALLLTMLVFPGAASAADVLAVAFPHGVMKQCSGPVTERFVVRGPGAVTITENLIPYKGEGGIGHSPLAYRLVSSGSEFGKMIPLPGHQWTKRMQHGKEVRNFIDRVPMQIQHLFKLDKAEEYVIEVRAYPICWLMRQTPYWQEGQEIRMSVTSVGGPSGGATEGTGGQPIAGPGRSDPARPGTTPEPSTGEPGGTCVPRQIFSTLNKANVMNGPTRPTTFTLGRSTRITKITTYHWNNRRGAKPGTISLQSSSGQIFGPWRTIGEPGMGGLPNAMWVATPNVVLPAGTYTVIDSDPATWSYNQQSGGSGMAWADGCPVAQGGVTPPPPPPAPPAAAVDISGAWNHGGRNFTVSQTGSRFTWTVRQDNETAQGTINGKEISVRWTGGPWGSGSATGSVTESDSRGRSLKIQWSNGAVWYR